MNNTAVSGTLEALEIWVEKRGKWAVERWEGRKQAKLEVLTKVEKAYLELEAESRPIYDCMRAIDQAKLSLPPFSIQPSTLRDVLDDAYHLQEGILQDLRTRYTEYDTLERYDEVQESYERICDELESAREKLRVAEEFIEKHSPEKRPGGVS